RVYLLVQLPHPPPTPTLFPYTTLFRSQRTGIKQRHIAADGEFTSHLAINAARAALADAGLDAQSIDLIVLATSTPDNTFPATAVDRKSTRLNSSHLVISYAVFCLKKKI